MTLCDHWLWTECALSYNNKKVQRQQQQRNSRRKTLCDHLFWIACGLLHNNTKTQQQHRNSRRKTLCDDGLWIACGLSHRSRTLYCIYSPYSGHWSPVNNNTIAIIIGLIFGIVTIIIITGLMSGSNERMN